MPHKLPKLLTPLNLGCVNYINALPFSIALEKQTNFALTYGVPTKLNFLLEKKKLDIALTSSIIQIKNNFNFIPNLGISCKGRVTSVNLYVKNNFFNKKSPSIGLTQESATSVALLKILCHNVWKQTPCFFTLNDLYTTNCDAKLIIGDKALLNPNFSGFTTTDLCLEWTSFTGLPFVFALFVIGESIPSSSMDLLQNLFSFSLDISVELINRAKKHINLSEKELFLYYNSLNYKLDSDDLKGLEKFKELSSKIE